LNRRSHSPPLIPYTTLFRSNKFSPIDNCSFELQIKPRRKYFTRIQEEAILEPESTVQRQGQLATAPVSSFIMVRTCLRQGRCKRSEEHTSELQSRENLVCRL